MSIILKIFLKFEKIVYVLLKPGLLLFLDKYSNKNNNSIEYDLVFVIPDGKAWILKGICEEVSQRLPKNVSFKIVTLSNSLPKAEIYFFSHFLLYSRSYFLNRHVRNHSKNFIHYTHFENDNKIRFKDLLLLLNYSNGLFFMNSKDLIFLSNYIIDKNKLFLNIGAVDTTLFKPINRLNNKYIGFISNFYHRKNPDLILEIIKSNTNREFKIIGSGWENYEKFSDLKSLENLKIIETSYINYPKEYQSLRIFISVSLIEGGPIPTLEALACNIFPIVTDTGFNSEVIVHGVNGFIVNENIQILEISKFIDLAWNFDKNVNQSIEKFNWDYYSDNIFNFLKINV
jgi:glycosyltransferase involved in cell wall biosynthesis